MKKSRIVLLLAILIAISNFNGCIAAEKDRYIMNGGDVLNIQVFDNPDLSSPKDYRINPYVVRPDGLFSMPLIGDIYVTGRTTFEVTNEIIEKLREYLRKPIVTINIVKPGTTRVYVLGEVKRQGLYELGKKHNLLDAISAAKGFTWFSNKKNVFVIRNGESEVVFKANLHMVKGNNLNKNIVLNEGDCVYLSSNNKVDFARDIYPFFRGAYYISKATTKDSNDDTYAKSSIRNSRVE